MDIQKIQRNFEKYFDANFLTFVIENGGWEMFCSGNKVAININTNEVFHLQNNESVWDKDVYYFTLPRIIDYELALKQEKKEGNYHHNVGLKRYISDYFKNVGHFLYTCDWHLVLKLELDYIDNELGLSK